LKITHIETLLVFAGWRNWVLVTMDTDQGITGVGEATLEGREKAVVGAIEDLARYLLGKDPFRIEEHWFTLYRTGVWIGPVTLTALSALEIAMWDIVGKVMGQPIYNLLGGQMRERVRVYANGWYFGARTPAEFAERAGQTVERGFSAIKFDPFGQAFLTISNEGLEEAVERVAAVRRAVGPKVDLLIEAHGRFFVGDAIRVAHRLEPFDCYWYEEPVPPDNLDALAEVTRHSPIMVVTGERCFTRFQHAELLPRQAARVIQADVIHAGGILETKKIAAMAEAWHTMIAPHNPNGPVATAATLQTVAGLPNFLILEMLVADPPWREDLIREKFEIQDGYLAIPDRPGLGVTLNHDAIAKHPYQPVDLSFQSDDSILNRPIVQPEAKQDGPVESEKATDASRHRV
jgi:galactonate dehydratase